MQQTEHYGLNQWEKTDRLLMADFNGDNAKIDAALAAEQTARESAVAALNQTVAGLGNCKIATGTYTGTGTHGADAPNSLIFPFEPKLVIIQNAQYASFYPSTGNDWRKAMLIMVRPLQMMYALQSSDSYGCVLTWSGKTLRWYNTLSEEFQMNITGNTYLYLAIG